VCFGPGAGKDPDVRVLLGDLDLTLVLARHKGAVLGILPGLPNKTHVLCECVKPHIWCMGGTVRRAGVGATGWRNGGQFNRPFVSEQTQVFAKCIQENRGHVL
jgi:hypothetical protein